MRNSSFNIIFILGAPKSGVCLLEKALHSLDLNNPVPRGDLNQIYQFSNQALTGFNKDGQLNPEQAGVRLHTLPYNWRDSKAALAIKQQIKDLLIKNARSDGALVLGHPSITCTLPLWLDICQELSVQAGFIHIIRHPWEMVSSFTAAEDTCPVKAQKLWLLCYRQVQDACRKEAHLIIDFERLITAPDAVLQHIADRFNLNFSTLKPVKQELETEKGKPSAFINPDLCHYRSADMLSQDQARYAPFIRLYNNKTVTGPENSPAVQVCNELQASHISASFINIMKKMAKPVVIHQDFQARYKEYQQQSDSLNSNACLTSKTFWGAPVCLFPGEVVSSKIYTFGFFEAGLTAFFIDYLQYGSTVIDVGAHIGYYSMLAAELIGPAGKVYSFEPTPATAELLKKNVEQYARVSIITRLAWDKLEQVAFQVYDAAHSAYNTAVSHRLSAVQDNNAETKTITVDAVTLDSFCLLRNICPDLVKVDAESAEMQVLSGMIGLLEKARPLVTIEVGDLAENTAGQIPSSKDLLKFVGKFGYEPLEAVGGRLQGHQISEGKYEYDNIIMVPTEKLPARRPLGTVGLNKGRFY